MNLEFGIGIILEWIFSTISHILNRILQLKYIVKLNKKVLNFLRYFREIRDHLDDQDP